jgi:hypothetical protein
MRLFPGPHTFALDLVLPEGAVLAADAGTFAVACTSGASVVTTPRVQPVAPRATFTAEVAAGASTLALTGTVRFVLDDRTHARDFAVEVEVTGTPNGEPAPLPVTIRLR